MSGRICEIHGEWCPDGACRWCEEPKRMPTNLPAGSTPCRCGEYSWLPEVSPDMREGVISGMFHSPAQCFKLGADPPGTERILVEMVDDGPFRPPMIVEWRIRTEPERTEAVIDAETTAAEQSRLEVQHAALRWERVARRWNYKHRRTGGLDERGRAYVWRCWLEQQRRRWEAEIRHPVLPVLPVLPVPSPEPKP